MYNPKDKIFVFTRRIVRSTREFKQIFRTIHADIFILHVEYELIIFPTRILYN